MKTRSRNFQRYRNDRSRSGPQWNEHEFSSGSGYRNLQNEGFNRGYQDRQERNDWYYNEDIENNPNRGFDDEYNSSDDQFGAYGRGTNNPQREEPHFMNNNGNRYYDNRDRNSGYKRRRNNEPNPYYTDKYYYNPSDYDEGPFRKNYRSDNYNQRDNFDDFNEDDNDYDYYESYPRYGQVSAQDDYFRRNRKFPYGNEENMNKISNYSYTNSGNGNYSQQRRRENRRYRRPNIRDKHY